MIVVEQKPLEELLESIKGMKKVLVIGCGGCVSVCLAGGEKETGILASTLRMKRKLMDEDLETMELTLTRQCDPEYIGELSKKLEGVDCVLSLACGVGVQFIAEKYPDMWVLPAMNTKFAGATIEHGLWEERCGLCGECVLGQTGGICPIIRCAKSLLNGPCGGSQNGKCEVKPNECAWHLIYERMNNLGRIEQLFDVAEAKDWSKSRDGGPRKVVREDVKIDG
jgi:ferredoxin